MNIINSDEFVRNIVLHISNYLAKYKEQYFDNMGEKKRRDIQLSIVRLLDDVLCELRVRLNNDRDILYAFNGHCWIEIDRQSISNIVRFIYCSVFDSIHLTASIVNEIVSMVYNSTNFLPLNEIKKSYINFFDGVYDIINTKRVGNSDMFFFKNSLDYKFSDVAESQDCPNFRKFLYDVCYENDKSEEYIKAKMDVIISFMCYALFGELKIERALVLYGSGSNGKSTLINIIRRLYGDHNISSIDINKIERTKLDLFEMQGKMLNICSELRFDEKTDIDLFKRIVSKEHITARRLYSPPQELKDFPAQIFATNSIPHFGEIDNAIIRRLLIIDFKNTFEEDPHFMNRFENEYPAILKYVLTYIDAVSSGKIVGEDKLRANTRILLSSRNSIEQYLLACGDTHGEQNASISLNAMYSNDKDGGYIGYCRIYGYKAYSFNVFCEQVKKILNLKIKLIKRNKRMYYYIDNIEYFKALEKLYANYKYEVENETKINEDFEF